MILKGIDLLDLSAEVTGVSMMLLGLSNQLDRTKTDTLSNDAMKDALYGVSMHLNRIASDLENMTEKRR